MIKEKLLGLPNEIESLKLVDLKEGQRLESEIEALRTWELQELDDIANAVDENGKTIYSNDTKRKAELERRKAEDKEYQDTQKLIKHLEYEKSIRQIKLDRLYNEQGNLRAVCRLEGQE